MTPRNSTHAVAHQAFYAELTARNRGFVPAGTQARLATAGVLVAGCGSTGGAAVEPLTRLGVQHFVLADNGAYELNNLNRQNAFVEEIGEPKAAVCARRVLAVNPWAHVEVVGDGVQPGTVEALVEGCDVVVDGVDVTEPAGWVAKFALHEAAARLRRPVISGYDMAGTQYVRCYDYPRAGGRGRAGSAFGGRITAADVAAASASPAGAGTWTLLRRVVPMRAVPVEMLEAARRDAADPAAPISQVVYASLLFGSITARQVMELLDGRPVRRHTIVSVDRAVSPAGARLRARLRTPLVAALALADLARLRRTEPAHHEPAHHEPARHEPAQKEIAA